MPTFYIFKSPDYFKLKFCLLFLHVITFCTLFPFSFFPRITLNVFYYILVLKNILIMKSSKIRWTLEKRKPFHKVYIILRKKILGYKISCFISKFLDQLHPGMEVGNIFRYQIWNYRISKLDFFNLLIELELN